MEERAEIVLVIIIVNALPVLPEHTVKITSMTAVEPLAAVEVSVWTLEYRSSPVYVVLATLGSCVNQVCWLSSSVEPW